MSHVHLTLQFAKSLLSYSFRRIGLEFNIFRLFAVFINQEQTYFSKFPSIDDDSCALDFYRCTVCGLNASRSLGLNAKVRTGGHY